MVKKTEKLTIDFWEMPNEKMQEGLCWSPAFKLTKGDSLISINAGYRLDTLADFISLIDHIIFSHDLACHANSLELLPIAKRSVTMISSYIIPSRCKCIQSCLLELQMDSLS